MHVGAEGSASDRESYISAGVGISDDGLSGLYEEYDI